MRETIEKLKEYIDENCVEGRDDFEISVLYNCISSLYSAIEVIKTIEDRAFEEHDCKHCTYDCSECEYNKGDVDT